jgi:[ribosomal protein S18]-alanine N-acetyltransferase
LSLNATHYLEVRESNIGARKLYQRVGFTEVGRRPDYYTNPIETAIVMQMK